MSKLDQYYRLNKVAGVNIHLENDGVHIYLCAVEADGNQLSISKKVVSLTSPGQLKEHLSAKTVISLDLSGKGVLQRRIDRTGSIDINTFSKILPNAKLEDFYIQNFISGEYSFVSVIRKSEADKWLAELRELSFQPLLLSLGVFPVDHIMPQLNVYEADLIVGGYQIQRNESGEWLDSKSVDDAPAFPFKLGSEKIDDKLLIPYAAAFQLVMISKLDPIAAGVKEQSEALQTRLAEQKFKVHGAILLAVVFILLLLNILALSWLNSSNADLSAQVGKYAATTSNEQDLASRVKEKAALLRSLGWDGGVNKSGLIDEVCSLLPPEVTLRAIAVNPEDVAASRVQRSIVFYDRKIIISGNSQKIIPVNEWIARLKTRPWVKNIQLENFTYDNELNTGSFTVSINY